MAASSQSTRDVTDGHEEAKPLVGFLGPQASYSHQASLQAFPKENWDLRPLVTIPDIFASVQAGEVSFGVVPFENSTNGSVVFTLDCFADRHDLSSDVAVCGEIYLDVHHYLVGYLPPSPSPVPSSGSSAVHPPSQSLPAHPNAAAATAAAFKDDASSGACTPTASDPHPLKPRSKPRCELSHIRRLYSHPQAWGQCSAFLQTYLKGVEAVDVSSTSRAAELVALDNRDKEGGGLSAAISSEVAAGLHGIDVLAASIEDREDNTTRFFVIRKVGSAEENSRDEPALLPERLRRSRLQEENGEGAVAGARGKTKSMVSFMVPHEAPGALADVLECFRKFGLNLTSINSRPSLEKPFQYVFFVEFEGHRSRDPEGRVEGVLEGVGKVAETWRWLGSWEDQRS